MSADYTPREHDHKIEPLFEAVRGLAEDEEAPASPARREAWASVWVPLVGLASAILVWFLYRLFQ
ncbi:MAG: hypothetical protein ABGY71_10610 [bacterium]|jgi:hypothetical protein|nr:hypothetical protein [Planctomycetota bacterium]HIL51028.1 hypothetical protein [Planctomycetota bacterium]